MREKMIDGVPVGRSFEVPGADLEQATANAWRAAEAAGVEYGRSLYSEQLSAGVWEVVLVEVEPGWTAPERSALRAYAEGLDRMAARAMLAELLVELARDAGTPLLFRRFGQPLPLSLADLTSSDRDSIVGIEVHIDAGVAHLRGAH